MVCFVNAHLIRFWSDNETDAVIRQTVLMLAPDMPRYLRAWVAGLRRVTDDPKPFLNGSERLLNEYWIAEVTITSRDARDDGKPDTGRAKAKEAYFMDEVCLILYYVFGVLCSVF